MGKSSFFNDLELTSIPVCNSKYFPKIVEKGIEKSLPFRPLKEYKGRRKGEKGFIDCVIWYSIMEFVKNSKFEEAKLIFITKNKKDFLSDKNLDEFKTETKKSINIINYDEWDNVLLEDFSKIKIENIDIFYSERNNLYYLHNVILYSSEVCFDLSNSLKISYETINFEKIIKQDIIKVLSENKYKTQEIEFDSDLVVIINVVISLRGYKGIYYDFLSVTLEYDNGAEEVLSSDVIDTQINIESPLEEAKQFVIGALTSMGYDLEHLDDVEINIDDYIPDNS